MNVTTTQQTIPQTALPTGPAAEQPAPAAVPSIGRNLPVLGLPSPVEHHALAGAEASIEKAIEQIQAFLKESNRKLTFERDEASGRVIMRVMDAESGEVVRQFPTEELLKIAATVDAQGFHTFDELA